MTRPARPNRPAGPAAAAVQKLRAAVDQARPDQLTVAPYLTVKQVAALLAWIDRQDTSGA